MAAPMLLASVIPLSTTLPTVTWVTRGPGPRRPSTTAPAAVAVHWAVGGRWPPYSRGVRYCRSAEQKWEEVAAAAHCPKPPSSSMAPRARLSPMVEQAPYSPQKGTPQARAAKAEPTHWLRRSPASSMSSSSAFTPARSRAFSRAMCCMALSAFSQLSWPKVSSGEITSNRSPRGPSCSFPPPTLPNPRITGGRVRAKVCFPSFFADMLRPPSAPGAAGHL